MDKSLTYIDLFAGCGGFSVGLSNAGLSGLFAVEKNKDAFSTLKHNLIEKKDHFRWPQEIECQPWCIDELLQKHRKPLAKYKKKVDLIVGGPPCQGFSQAGRRQETDARNNLANSYLEFVKLTRPRVIILENVKGFAMRFLANGQGDTRYSEKVISGLVDLGYKDAAAEIIDTYDYGVPQKRERFIAIASRENISQDIFTALKENRHDFLKRRGIGQKNNVQFAISDLEMKHGTLPSPDSKGFNAGIKGDAKTGLQKYLRKGQKQVVPDSHRYVNHTNSTIKTFNNLLAYAPRVSNLSEEARNKYGVKKRNIAVLCPTSPSRTITTIPDDFVHYCEPRVLTPRECARIQTFPDWFCFQGPYTTGGERRVKTTPRYTQIGNAVPPLFAEQLGEAIKEVTSYG